MRLFSILAIIALAAGCSQDDSAGNKSGLPPGHREAQIGPLGINYDSNRLAIAQVSVPLPYDAKRQVRGMKLISKAREEFVDEPRCPEKADDICRAESEGGLTLTVLNQPYADFISGIRRTSPANVAGREGVTWDGRFGDAAATFTAIPVEQQTLLMIRQTSGEGAPDAATLDAVLGTFRFGPRPEPEKGRR